MDPDKLTDHKTYIDNLCSNFEMRLKDMIKKGIDDKSRESFSDPIYDEILQHIVFSQNKSEGFYGREDTIEVSACVIILPKRYENSDVQES